jgi:hypothetical protein
MQKNYLDAQTLPSKKPQSFVFFCLSVQSRILLCFRSASLHLPAAAAAAAVLHLLMWRKMARVDYELRVKFKRHRQAFSWSTISPEVVLQVQQSFISSFFFCSPSSELAGGLAGSISGSLNQIPREKNTHTKRQQPTCRRRRRHQLE